MYIDKCYRNENLKSFFFFLNYMQLHPRNMNNQMIHLLQIAKFNRKFISMG